ncbi:MAG: transcriptional regulator [Desulfobacterium sp.]|nr:transcriptional regulator [Desulfobacterium sp.]
MTKEEFHSCRKRLTKTQVELSQILGISLKAVHSYEQGWRNVPTHVERQLYFLLSRLRGSKERQRPCWVVKNCPTERKKQCPAWEFKAGKLCWFINGTICDGTVQDNWGEKMNICRKCEVLSVWRDQIEPQV